MTSALGRTVINGTKTGEDQRHAARLSGQAVPGGCSTAFIDQNLGQFLFFFFL